MVRGPFFCALEPARLRCLSLPLHAAVPQIRQLPDVRPRRPAKDGIITKKVHTNEPGQKGMSMSDFMALLLAQQTERERTVALEQRRLLLEAYGTDPRFHRAPGVFQRLQAHFLKSVRSPGRDTEVPAHRAAGSAIHGNA